MADYGEVTALLRAMGGGDASAFDRVFPLVYSELQGMAKRQLAGRRRGATLDTTDLVHEAYLKLAGGEGADWQDRRHFYAVAALAMRHIVVDHARRRIAARRGGGAPHTGLDGKEAGAGRGEAEILAVDEALAELSALDPQLARVVELRFFGGLTVEETAEVLEVSPRTVKRGWRKARAVLHRILASGG